MLVRNLMTKTVARVAPEDTCLDAARLMRDKDCGAIPVADGDRLVGMITDRDIALRCVAEGETGDMKVGDAMTAEVLYCYEDQDLANVARNMGDMQIRRLPVLTRDKRLVGIISLGDIAITDAYHAGHALNEVSKPNGNTHA